VDFPEPSNPSTAINRPGNPNSAKVFINKGKLGLLTGKTMFFQCERRRRRIEQEETERTERRLSCPQGRRKLR
jgi:hypothetical protein